ncbi:MAG: hypothetical protein AAF799_30980 [Myxococcota bacterium]
MMAVPLVIGWATGCAEEPLPEPAPETALELGELATGRIFAPYEAESPVAIEQGLQGGFHVFVDGRLVGDEIEAECLISLRMIRMDDDLEVASIDHLREPDLLQDTEGHRTFDDLIVFIPEPDTVDGRLVRIEATAEVDGVPLEGDEVLLALEYDGV